MDRRRFVQHQQNIERQMHQVWAPHEGQVPIAVDFFINWVSGIFLRCGRKYGKTEVAIYCMYIFGLLFENSECYYVADEKDHARDICWDNRRLPEFFTSFSPRRDEPIESFRHRRSVGRKLQDNWVRKVNESEMTVRLHNNSMLKVDGAKNWKKADGISPIFLVYDEFKNHDPRYDRAARPNLMTFNGRIMIIGTPPDNEENYYCETETEFYNREGYRTYIMPSWKNPHVYDGPDCPKLKAEKDALSRKGELHVYLREYECRIVPDTKRQIFPMFQAPGFDQATGRWEGRTDHVRPHFEVLSIIRKRWKDWDWYASFDPGSAVCFAGLFVAINRYTKQICFLDEIYETEQLRTSTRVVYPQAIDCMEELNPYGSDWYQSYDHAATWFANEVHAEWTDVNLMPCTKDLNNKENKLGLMKDIMLEPDLFIVSDRCQNFISEVVHYAKDENGRIPKKKDHTIDCGRYVLNDANYDVLFREYKEQRSDRRFETPESDFLRDLARIGGYV